MKTQIKDRLSVVILAGGYGTRLRENGFHIPKGLICAGNTTIVGRLLSDIESSLPKSDVCMVTNNVFATQYEAWLKRHSYIKRVTLLHNGSTSPETRKGALGDLYFALDYMKWWNNNILVLPSDTLYAFSLQEFIYDIVYDPLTIRTVFRDMKTTDGIKNRLGCGVLEGEKLIEFEEKPLHPKSTYASIPLYYFPKHTLSLLSRYKAQGNNMDAPGQILSWCLKQHESIHATIVTGETLDVGIPEDIFRAGSFFDKTSELS